MLSPAVILAASMAYMCLLFAIAYIGDRRADQGRSLIANPYIYALSMAVFCTAWTYYGSVGLAARHGPSFLPIYLGPTLMAALGGIVLRKIIRISRNQRITSIADFIASRYGKSTVLGGVVTLIAVVGIIPYISLQLKAISVSFLICHQFPDISLPVHFVDVPVLRDTAFHVALILAIFAILFGTRHLEATERHEGLVAAIAFESIVKLVAFMAVGIFVTYGLYDGMADVMAEAWARPELARLFVLPAGPGAYADWALMVLLSMAAITFLPRQFQVAVVENVDERHLNQAIWLFPLYMLAINIFVLPIAIGGLLRFPGAAVDPDTFVLTLPMSHGHRALALLVYIGGMSAATGMVIVETVTLSTMICNDLVMPALLRPPLAALAGRLNLSRLLLTIRRVGILMVLLMGYAYFRFIGEFYELVSIGLVSFAAVAQFGPAIIGGIFWKGGNRAGALGGLLAGFAIWFYTLVVPSLAQTGFLPPDILEDGLFGIALLRPLALFGLTELDGIAHAVFWSLLINTGVYIALSILVPTTTLEHTQAALFVDVFQYAPDGADAPFWRGTASVTALRELLERFLGRERAANALSRFSRKHHFDWQGEEVAHPSLVDHAEKLLAGVIGSASARVMVASVAKEEPLGMREVMRILDETRQVIAYSRELERTTAELKAANERLKELDRLKDEFVSTVSHELRTPITSVKALAEILRDNPDLDATRRGSFSAIIVRESERLTRLITQMLDLRKIESGRMEWRMDRVDVKAVIQEAADITGHLLEEKSMTLALDLPETRPVIIADRDRLIQVMVNLISNGVKFSDGGGISIRLAVEPDRLIIAVRDTGIGIPAAERERIFERFHQIRDRARGRPAGSGLGLAITRRIVTHLGGAITVESAPGKGSTFTISLPRMAVG